MTAEHAIALYVFLIAYTIIGFVTYYIISVMIKIMLEHADESAITVKQIVCQDESFAISVLGAVIWPSSLLFIIGYAFGDFYYKKIITKGNVLSELIPYTRWANDRSFRKGLPQNI